MTPESDTEQYQVSFSLSSKELWYFRRKKQDTQLSQRDRAAG